MQRHRRRRKAGSSPLIDAMFPGGARSRLASSAAPTAVFVHTFVLRQLDMWRGIFAHARRHAPASRLRRPAAARRSLGTARSHRLDESRGLRRAGRRPAGRGCATPARCSKTKNSRSRRPCPGRRSTRRRSSGQLLHRFEQRNVDKVQRALDALADLPVHVVATTGGIVAPNEVATPPQRCRARLCGARSDHAPRGLVVTHGGHGTAMRALRHGVPMILIPGLAGDQPFVAAAVQEFGAGLALPGDAGVEAIRAAAQQILATASFKHNARERLLALAGVDGAANAADEVEALLGAKRATTDDQAQCQRVA